MNQYFHKVMRFLEHIDPQEWLLVICGVVIVGLVCMRGFGSRRYY